MFRTLEVPFNRGCRSLTSKMHSEVLGSQNPVIQGREAESCRVVKPRSLIRYEALGARVCLAIGFHTSWSKNILGIFFALRESSLSIYLSIHLSIYPSIHYLFMRQPSWDHCGFHNKFPDDALQKGGSSKGAPS